jgi:hypothetical protein
MARNGKIARLPLAIREELNQRLQNGEPHVDLVAWLNGRDDVRAVLARLYKGHEVYDSNLTEWVQGGYEDWSKHQDALEWVRETADESAELQEAAEDRAVTDLLAAPVAVMLGRCLKEAAAAAQTDPQKWKDVLAASREINQLRRGDHEERRIRSDEARRAAEAEEAESRRRSEQAMSPFYAFMAARDLEGFAGDSSLTGNHTPPSTPSQAT